MTIDIQKIKLSDFGFSGYLAGKYQSSEHGVVIILGGESVMLPFLKLGKSMAKWFAREGFIAVSVSLFGSEGLPDSPDQIPLEYALNAVNYLKNVEKCTEISVFGMSMGSIVALGTAIYSNDVDNLIMMSPSHVAFEGVSKDKKVMKGRSFLTLNGKDIPFVRADFSRYKMYRAYKIAYADKERELEAMTALPITAVKSRILLMAGEKDSSWPSAYSVKKLYNRLKRYNTKYSYKKILYPEYGHMLPLKKDVMREVFFWMKHRDTIDRKNTIMKSYHILGNIGSVYDGIVSYSTPLGKLMNKMMWGFNKETTSEWMNSAMSGIPKNFNGKLLEVPVGTGVLTMPLYKSISDADITCLDYSVDMMDNAKKRAEAMDVKNITFLQGDVGQLPFADESFDIVLSLNGFHVFPDKEAAYRETYRVLKKGGIFCGCFYIKGESRRTDWVTKNIFVPKGSFTPPFETAESLPKRLQTMYENVSFHQVRGLGTFVCRKG